MEDDNPYGIGEHLAEVSSVACKPLHFTTPIEPGDHGPFYEIRSYTMLPGGMPQTEAAWAKAVPAREKLSKILMVMGSIDCVPQKLVHIWTYPSLDARTEARAETHRQKIWPPLAVRISTSRCNPNSSWRCRSRICDSPPVRANPMAAPLAHPGPPWV